MADEQNNGGVKGDINASIGITFEPTVENLSAINDQVNSLNENLGNLVGTLEKVGGDVGKSISSALKQLADSDMTVNVDGEKIRMSLTEKILKKLENPTIDFGNGGGDEALTLKIDSKVATQVRQRIVNTILDQIKGAGKDGIKVSGNIGNLTFNLRNMGNLKSNLEQKLTEIFDNTTIEIIDKDKVLEAIPDFQSSIVDAFQRIGDKAKDMADAIESGAAILGDTATDVKQAAAVAKTRKATSHSEQEVTVLPPKQRPARKSKKPLEAPVQPDLNWEEFDKYNPTAEERLKTDERPKWLASTFEPSMNMDRKRLEQFIQDIQSTNDLHSYLSQDSEGLNPLDRIVRDVMRTYEEFTTKISKQLRDSNGGTIAQYRDMVEQFKGRVNEAYSVLSKRVQEYNDNLGKVEEAPANRTETPRETVKIAREEVATTAAPEKPKQQSSAPVDTSIVERKLSQVAGSIAGNMFERMEFTSDNLTTSAIMVNLPKEQTLILEDKIKAWVVETIPSMLANLQLDPFRGEGNITVPPQNVHDMQALETAVIERVVSFINDTLTRIDLSQVLGGVQGELFPHMMPVDAADLHDLEVGIVEAVRNHVSNFVRNFRVESVDPNTLGAEHNMSIPRAQLTRLRNMVLTSAVDVITGVMRNININWQVSADTVELVPPAEVIDEFHARLNASAGDDLVQMLSNLNFDKLNEGWEPQFPEQAIEDMHRVINKYLEDEVNFIADKFKTLSKINMSSGTKFRKEWRGKINQPEANVYNDLVQDDGGARFRELFSGMGEQVQSLNDQFDKIMQQVPTMNRKKFGSMMNSLQKEITEAYSKVTEMDKVNPYQGSSRIQTLLDNYQQTLLALMDKFNEATDTVSKKYFQQELDKINEISELQKSFSRSVQPLGVEKFFDKVTQAIQNYFNTVGQIMENLDGLFQLRTEELNKQAQNRIRKQMGLKKNEDLPEFVSSNDYVDMVIKSNLDEMNKMFVNKARGSVDSIFAVWKDKIKNYSPTTSLDLENYLKRKFSNLTKLIVKKTQDIVDAQFARLEQEIMNGTVPDSRSLQRKQVLQRMGQYQNPSSRSGNGSGSGGSGGNGGGGSSRGSSTGRLPLDPMNAPRQEVSKHGVGSHVQRHINSLLAGSLIGLPLGAAYSAWENYSATEDNMANLRNSLSVAVDSNGVSVSAGELEQRFQTLSDSAMSLSIGFGKALDQVVAAMTQASLRFKDVTNITRLTTASLALSRVDGSQQPQEYTRQLEALMTQYNITDTSHINQYAGYAALLGNVLQTSPSDILEGMTRSGSVLSTAGVDIYDAMKLQAFANHANDSSGATTGNMLKTVVSRLSMPKVMGTLETIGVNNPQYKQLMTQTVDSNGAVTETSVMTLLDGLSKMATDKTLSEHDMENVLKTIAGGQQSDKMVAMLQAMVHQMQQVDAEMGKYKNSPQDFLYQQLGSKLNTPQGHLDQLKSQWDVTSYKVLTQFTQDFTNSLDGIRTLLAGIGDHAHAFAEILKQISALATGLLAKFAFDKIVKGFNNMRKSAETEKLAMLYAANQREALGIAKDRAAAQPYFDMQNRVDMLKQLSDNEKHQADFHQKTVDELEAKKSAQGGNLDQVDADLLNEAYQKRNSHTMNRLKYEGDSQALHNQMQQMGAPDMNALNQRYSDLQNRMNRLRDVMKGLGIPEEDVVKKMEEMSNSSKVARQTLAQLDQVLNVDSMSTKELKDEVDKLAQSLRNATQDEKALTSQIMQTNEAQASLNHTMNQQPNPASGSNGGNAPHPQGNAPTTNGTNNHNFNPPTPDGKSMANDIEELGGGLNPGGKAGSKLAGLANLLGLNKVFSSNSIMAGSARAAGALGSLWDGAAMLGKGTLYGLAAWAAGSLIQGGLGDLNHAMELPEDQQLDDMNAQKKYRDQFMQQTNPNASGFTKFFGAIQQAYQGVSGWIESKLTGDQNADVTLGAFKSEDQMNSDLAKAQIEKGKKQMQLDDQFQQQQQDDIKKGIASPTNLSGLNEKNQAAQYIQQIGQMQLSIAQATGSIRQFGLAMQGWAQDSPKMREAIIKSAQDQISIQQDMVNKLKRIYNTLTPTQQDDEQGISIQQQITQGQQAIAQNQMAIAQALTSDVVSYIDRRRTAEESIEDFSTSNAVAALQGKGLDSNNPLLLQAEQASLQAQIASKQKTLDQYNSAQTKVDNMSNGTTTIDGGGNTVNVNSLKSGSGTDVEQMMALYSDYINPAAQKYNLSPELLAAMIMQESGGNPTIQSADGGKGLMQLTSQQYVDEVNSMGGWKDPASNIMVGAEALRQKIDDAGGNLLQGLANYNGSSAYIDQVTKHMSKDQVQAVFGGNVSTSSGEASQPSDGYSQSDQSLEVTQKRKELELQITQLKAQQHQFVMQDLQYYQTMSGYQMSMIQARGQVAVDKLLLAGASQNSMLVKYTQAQNLNDQYSQDQKDVAEMQAKLSSGVLSSDEYKQVQSQMYQKQAEATNLLVQIRDIMKQGNGTFNLPDGIKPLDYFDYVMNKGKASSYAIHSGDVYVNVAVDKLHANDQNDVNQFAQTIGGEIVSQQQLLAFGFAQSMGGLSTIRSSYEQGANVPSFMK